MKIIIYLIALSVFSFRKKRKRISFCSFIVAVNGFVFCYASLPLAAPVLDIILPLNETRSRNMPHLADFVVFDQKNHYYTVLLILYVGYLACVSIAVAADTLYIFFVEHICGMYSVLW